MCLIDCFRYEDPACDFLERFLWPEGPICPHCGEMERVRHLYGSTAPGTWKCYACRKMFSARMKTPFHNSHLPLHASLQAIYLLAATQGRIGSSRLATILGVSQRAAWLLKKRIMERSGRHIDGPVQQPSSLIAALAELADWQDERPSIDRSWSCDLRYDRFRLALDGADETKTDGLFLVSLHRFVGDANPAIYEPIVGAGGGVLLLSEDCDGQFEFDLGISARSALARLQPGIGPR